MKVEGASLACTYCCREVFVEQDLDPKKNHTAKCGLCGKMLRFKVVAPLMVQQVRLVNVKQDKEKFDHSS